MSTIVKDNKKRKVRGQAVAGGWKLMISSRSEKREEGKRVEEGGKGRERWSCVRSNQVVSLNASM